LNIKGNRLQRFAMILIALLVLVSVATDVALAQFGTPDTEKPIVTGTASFKMLAGSKTTGQLIVQLKVTDGFHVYSVTQKPGGPIPSKVTLGKNSINVELGTVVPNKPPELHDYDVFPDLVVEEHKITVTWKASLQFAAAVDNPAKLKLNVNYRGLACTDDLGICQPADLSLTAVYAGEMKTTDDEPVVDDSEDHPDGIKSIVELIGDPPPAGAFGGLGDGFGDPAGPLVSGSASFFIDAKTGKGQVRFSVTVVDGYHIYSLGQKPGGPLPTRLIVSGSEGLEVAGAVSGDKKPEIHHYDVYEDLDVEEIKGTMNWWIPIQMDKSQLAAGEQIEVVVTLDGLACTDDLGTCTPQNLRIIAESDSSLDDVFQSFMSIHSQISVETPAAPESNGESTDPVVAVTGTPPPTTQRSLAGVLAFALLGGFILNFMPCVLPVIGLKVMSFVQQAGESRRRVFTLNLWYALGLMSVFVVFATLALFVGLGWGQQNQNDSFNIVMVAVIFVMALSFIGVWEIPIPGFVGSGKIAEKSEKEGPFAAYTKGIITTLLAIPCSGPGLGIALTYCAKQMAENPGTSGMINVYSVFVALGLGMAFPYIVIGAFPALVNFLPKPGAWMETFKELMGYILLGTVVFIMTYISFGLVVPTMAFLFALWAACWWLGRIPFTATSAAKLRSRTSALAFAVVAGWFCFTLFGEYMGNQFQSRIEQEIAASEGDGKLMIDEEGDNVYTAQRLETLLDSGRYVMVDFTADWCLTCKTLEQAVLKTDTVQTALHERGVVQMVADWTKLDTVIGKQIETEIVKLKTGKQLPIIAFYFPNDRANPRTLVAVYTTAGVLEILKDIPVAGDIARNASTAVGSDQVGDDNDDSVYSAQR
jgi:suppressor for copper-sensitivity B